MQRMSDAYGRTERIRSAYFIVVVVDVVVFFCLYRMWNEAFFSNSFIVFVVHRIGVVFYEYMQLKKTLNSLVSTDAIDINAKHPDYIYIKYHIYRESMLRRKHEELADKVCINCDYFLIVAIRFWDTVTSNAVQLVFHPKALTHTTYVSFDNRNGWTWLCIRSVNGGRRLSIRWRGTCWKWPKVAVTTTDWRRCNN